MIPGIGHVDTTIRAYGYTGGLIELTVAIPFASPLGQKSPIGGELLKAMIICIGHIDIAAHSHAASPAGLPIAGAMESPSG